MSNQAVVGVIGLVLLVAVGATVWFQFFAPQTPQPLVEEKRPMGYIPQIINAKHQYRGGLHTIAGEVDLPTPCYLLETDAYVEVREPASDLATIQFSTTGEDEICAQVITAARFKETFSSQEDAEITAQWNGESVKLNLIEVGEGEDLDDFEIFIKG